MVSHTNSAISLIMNQIVAPLCPLLTRSRYLVAMVGLGFMCLALHAESPPATVIPAAMDLSHAVLVTAKGAAPLEKKAAVVFREEVQKRTGILLTETTSWPDSGEAVVSLSTSATESEMPEMVREQLDASLPSRAESFRIVSKGGPRPLVVVCGADPRGLLYGVGRLLRKLELRKQSISLSSELQITSAPALSLRGDQLGYRPKVNAYDAWSPEQFDQYIRELALFGANSIELVPPRTDDQRTSPLMKLPPIEMMTRLSEIIDSYGLDVWIWYPNMGKDFVTQAGIDAEVAERDDVFRRLKRVDQVLVPAGDPGNLDPDVFFPWIDKMAVTLHKYHPKAKIWVAPQAFNPTKAWMESFYRHINAKPDWLGGVVYGPWIPTPLPEMRQIVDASLPIRYYPDITHNLDCQYPVQDWDPAYAYTLHRECCNPRPAALKTIHDLYARYTCGSLCYSEGINDDINKFLWLDQDWDASTQAIDTLRDYCRLFISPDLTNELADGIIALEKDWVGPLAVNRQVDVTFNQWRRIEAKAALEVKNQFRFQMPLQRAYLDDYIRHRLLYEMDLERQATDVLRTASSRGTFSAMETAEAILRRAITEPVEPGLKAACVQLSDSLFAKIGWQTSVERHGAEERTRGAFMDGIDEPLNNAAWLKAQFRAARNLPDEPARLAAIDQILNRTNPGPGGYYDSLGDPACQRRPITDIAWKDDPGTLRSPRVTFYYKPDWPEDREIPLAWKKQADTLYSTPLRLAYDNLDPQAEYSVRATYSGRTSGHMRLMANDQFLLSDKIVSRHPIVQEHRVPKEATAGGHLELEWTAAEGERSCEVAEVWLIRNPHPQP